jgi:hypothetical protein
MIVEQANRLRLAIEDLIRRYPEIAEDEVLREDMLEGETSIDEVLGSLARVRRDTRGLRDDSKAQLEDLKARRERFDRRYDFFTELMTAVLDVAGLRTIYLRNNPPNIVGEVDPEKLPDDLVKIERKADRDKIKEALKAGRELEGLALSNSPPSLVVTVK